jgi:hypothetical protein
MNMAFISGCSLAMIIISAYDDDELTSLEMTVESNPCGADVYLDGKNLGSAPITVKIEGLSKEHKIVLIKSGFRAKIETVLISPGRQLDEKYLSVTNSDGTSSRVENNILNVVLQKEDIIP